MIRRLLEMGADPRATDREGRNVLHFLVRTRTSEDDADTRNGMVAELIDRGADVHGVTAAGDSVLDTAICTDVARSRLSLIDLLQSRGARIRNVNSVATTISNTITHEHLPSSTPLRFMRLVLSVNHRNTGLATEIMARIAHRAGEDILTELLAFGAVPVLHASMTAHHPVRLWLAGNHELQLASGEVEQHVARHLAVHVPEIVRLVRDYVRVIPPRGPQ